METAEMNGGKVIQVNESDFDEQVLKAGIPVLVDFYADWCGPCKIVAPTFENLSREYEGRVKFVKINVDLNQDVASKYDIMSIPTAMLFANGAVKDRVVGSYPAATYRQRIDRALSA